ncbi:hypothetical protein [Paenibacillus sp. YN15]|uniref:hypothetical protein n=1 Tax=Paenibacillus sp. YN15 TaxID=1742774 RepID=UPI000DCD8323|nr:hypothetical protein [Paenibacillus sp. YN15]RAV04994.1 hypothetical protein DQG13_03700 [Paenibacillus sp. YN15]
MTKVTGRSKQMFEQLDVVKRFGEFQSRVTRQMDDHMIRKEKGHTREVSVLEYCHPGPETSLYYAAGAYLGGIGEEEGQQSLQELEKLQVQEDDHPQRGGFRWYREETQIDDTNAAFFTLVPLASLSLAAPQVIPSSHKTVIQRMFRRALHWFSHECANPKLFYPNKILSDGALLLALAVIVGDEEAEKGANAFFARWESYTTRRGWGWGENTSTGYVKVILNAFQLALRAWNGKGGELEAAIRARRDALLDYVRFHEGREFVPTIRSYNFAGQVIKPSTANLLAGVRFWEKETVSNIGSFVQDILLYEELFPQDGLEISDDPKKLLPAHPKLPVPRTWTERVFDDTFAYTWIGGNCRIGSLNRFPVMPGSYQWPSWGLGWQSMPASFLVEDEQVSFLRFAAREGERFRSHPSQDFHHAYLNPALFREECLPGVETLCTQKERILIVQRNIKHLANCASEIADEWLIQRFGGKVHKLHGKNRIHRTSTVNVTHSVPRNVENSGNQWIVLEYDHCYVGILALGYWGYGADEAQAGEPEIEMADGALRLRRILYRGDECCLRQHRLDNAWMVIMFDEKCSLDDLQKQLLQYEVTDRRLPDYEVPRDDLFMIREITVKAPDGSILTHRADPYVER